MAKDGRTEKPTAKKRAEARREGQIARSQEVGAALSLVGLLIVFRFMWPVLTDAATEGMATLMRRAALGPLDPELPGVVGRMVVLLLLPPLALSVVFAVLGGGVQTKFRLAPKAARPKLKKLSLKQGVQKFSPKTVGWELFRTLLKVLLVVAVTIGPVLEMATSVQELRTLQGWLDEIRRLAEVILIRAALLAVVIAAADYAWNRYRTEDQLKMTKDQVKDESRSAEGDPLIKGRRRSKMRDLSRNRIINAVGTADVVIVNPVRFAVALRYVEGDVAPRVVAKGAGRMAKRIRSEAYRNGVPVRQDPPLARALFRRCQVGQVVPAALYEAVAAVLAAVYRRKWRRTSGGRSSVPAMAGRS